MLKDVEAGEPFLLRNLAVVPIASDGERGNYVVLDEAIERGLAVVQDSGRVGSVILNYRGEIPLFIVDGEEIIGALQNRIVNTTVLVEEPVRMEVPVSCVEEGRWDGSRTFRGAGSSAYPSLRALLASSVTDSLRLSGKHSSDQGKIWESVSRSLESLRVSSMTKSMHDIYRGLEEDLNRYIEDVTMPENASGFMAWSGGKFIGLDYFGDRGLFEKLSSKLFRSYALEALARGPTDFPEDVEIEGILNTVRRRKFREFPAVGSGVEYRYKGRDYVGKALLTEDGRLLHLAFFPAPN